MMVEIAANDALAHAMIEVHGDRAADVARNNAREAALAGQGAPAKNWLKVVDAIQRQQRAVLSGVTNRG